MAVGPDAAAVSETEAVGDSTVGEAVLVEHATTPSINASTRKKRTRQPLLGNLGTREPMCLIAWTGNRVVLLRARRAADADGSLNRDRILSMSRCSLIS